MVYIPDGPERPLPGALDAFWARARAACPALPDVYQVRWIGLDAETTLQIFDLIRIGDKTGTFTLPWIVERTGQPVPRVGDCIILIDMAGTPTLVVRLERIHLVPFGEITNADTAVDGTPVRDISVWKPLHTHYWGGMLAPFGLAVSDDMPVWIEAFSLLYDDAKG